MNLTLESDLLIGYIFTIFNYIFYCMSRFCNKKYQMLTLDLLAKLSTFIALLFLNALSGAYSMLVSFVILIAANIKIRRKCVLPAWRPASRLYYISSVSKTGQAY